MIYRNDHYGPIDRFCAKHPRFGVPNLMMYLAIAQVAVGLVDLIMDEWLTALMMFSAPHIFAGQVWRLVTFVVVPSSSNPFYLLLGCYVYYWTGQMLERESATAKFNLFYLCGVVLSILLGLAVGYANIYYINLSLFLVIATLYGEMQVLFMMVVPIKMKWLAILDVVLILVDVVRFAHLRKNNSLFECKTAKIMKPVFFDMNDFSSDTLKTDYLFTLTLSTIFTNISYWYEHRAEITLDEFLLVFKNFVTDL